MLEYLFAKAIQPPYFGYSGLTEVMNHIALACIKARSFSFSSSFGILRTGPLFFAVLFLTQISSAADALFPHLVDIFKLDYSRLCPDPALGEA